jgi:hypothetical protein
MRTRERLAGHQLAVIRFALTALIACAALVSMNSSGAPRVAAQEESARIRIVHGVAGAGPLDVYIDGSPALFGILFGATSGELMIPGGSHEFAVAPSGVKIADALAEGTIELRSGNDYYTALLGTLESTSVGLFRVDTRALEPGQARFRVINGASDADAIVPRFAGGDALSAPLGFGDAPEYAALDAGAYDLELIDAASGSLLLSLPGTPFAVGTATDIIVIGQVGDGSLTAVVDSAAVEVQRPTGRTAWIVSGTCAQPGEAIADLGVVQPGQGEAVGAHETRPTFQGYALAPVPFAMLVDTPHAVVVAADSSAAGALVACGEIGGRLTDTGALVVALEGAGSTRADGIAVLAPSAENPETTGVSVFLASTGTNGGVASTPVAENG